MMHDMMNSGGMMWGMGLVGLFAAAVLILAAATPIKYFLSDDHIRGVSRNHNGGHP
jgi:hypothetical protein